MVNTLEGIMGATSVTGTGAGASNGLYKPELQCGGCGCGATEEPTPIVHPPTYCTVKYGAGRSPVSSTSSGPISRGTCRN